MFSETLFNVSFEIDLFFHIESHFQSTFIVDGTFVSFFFAVVPINKNREELM